MLAQLFQEDAEVRAGSSDPFVDATAARIFGSGLASARTAVDLPCAPVAENQILADGKARRRGLAAGRG